jgi:hypothetical protein
MFSIIKTTLVTGIVLGSASLAQAQGFDPNLANRYPGYAAPDTYGYSSSTNVPVQMRPAPQSAPVRLHQGRNAARTGGQASRSTVERNDRASSPNAGGAF